MVNGEKVPPPAMHSSGAVVSAPDTFCGVMRSSPTNQCDDLDHVVRFEEMAGMVAPWNDPAVYLDSAGSLEEMLRSKEILQGQGRVDGPRCSVENDLHRRCMVLAAAGCATMKGGEIGG